MSHQSYFAVFEIKVYAAAISVCHEGLQGVLDFFAMFSEGAFCSEGGHLTRGMAASAGLFRGVSVTDCSTTSWSLLYLSLYHRDMTTGSLSKAVSKAVLGVAADNRLKSADSRR